MSKLVAKREELAAKQTKLATIFEQAKLDDGSYDFTKSSDLTGDAAARLDQVRSLNDELDALGADVKREADTVNMHERVKGMAAEFNTPAGGMIHGTPGGEPDHSFTKSIGELFVGSPALKGWMRDMHQGPLAEFKLPAFKGGVPTGVILKTLFATTAGWAPDPVRTGKVVDKAVRPVQLLDFIPATSTTQSAVVYMEETTFTNNAAETAEGGTYPESALALTEKNSPVRKIANTLPVTDEQLEDVAQVQGYINNRLQFQLLQRLDDEVVNGDGIAPNLTGVLNTAGIQTQAKGADPTPDAIYKAIIKIKQTGRANADVVALNALDWQDIRLLRTADGVYIWGSPSESGPAAIWGLPVVIADQLAAGTGLCGDFGTYSELSFRRNVTLSVGLVNDDFKKGRQSIRADLRAAFVVYRPAAFCTVTGI